MRSVVLTGGVGGSGFLWGLAQELDHEALTVVVSTGDDFELHGLRISPSLDVVTYTLADLADAERGCGLAGDTFGCLQLLVGYGQPTWWRLGDRDLATHIFRTHAIRQGQRLTEVADRIHIHRLGRRIAIIDPRSHSMSDAVAIMTGAMKPPEPRPPGAGLPS